VADGAKEASAREAARAAQAASKKRRDGDPAGALALLEKAGRSTTRLRVEEALAAFALGDGARAKAAVEGDRRAASVLGPFLAAEGEGEVPRVPKGASPGRKALHELARGIVEVRRGKPAAAERRLRKLGDGPPLDAELHCFAAAVSHREGFPLFRAQRGLWSACRGDAALEAALGRLIATHDFEPPPEAPGRMKKAYEAERARRERGEPGSPSALLATEPARVPKAERGRLHLHRGFALIGRNPARAQRELEAALAAGEDQVEVLRGLFLAALEAGKDRAKKPMRRLARALERASAPEAALVGAIARAEAAEQLEDAALLREALEDAERFAARCAPSKDVTFALLRTRLDLCFAERAFDAAADTAREIVALRPTDPIARLRLAEAEESRGADPNTVLDVFRAGLDALDGAPGPETARAARFLEEEMQSFRSRRRRDLMPTRAPDWGLAYFAEGGQDASGAPSPRLLEAREALAAEDRRACLVLEAARRAAVGGLKSQGWLREWLEAKPGPDRDGILEISARMAPSALRDVAAELPAPVIEDLLKGTARSAVPLLLADHASRLSTSTVRAAKKVRPPTRHFAHAALAAAEERLRPDVDLSALILEGDAYAPEVAEDEDFPPGLEFLAHLSYDRASAVLDELQAGPGNPQSMLALLSAVEEAMAAAHARGEEIELPPPLDELFEASGIEGLREFREQASRHLPPPGMDIAPFGELEPAPARGKKAEQKAEQKARKKREKKNRKRGRGKKK
jgi:hypothetical protein